MFSCHSQLNSQKKQHGVWSGSGKSEVRSVLLINWFLLRVETSLHCPHGSREALAQSYSLIRPPFVLIQGGEGVKSPPHSTSPLDPSQLWLQNKPQSDPISLSTFSHLRKQLFSPATATCVLRACRNVQKLQLSVGVKPTAREPPSILWLLARHCR